MLLVAIKVNKTLTALTLIHLQRQYCVQSWVTGEDSMSQFKLFAMGITFAAIISGTAYAGGSDKCGRDSVLNHIQARFTYTAAHYLNSDIGISDIERVRENRLVSKGKSQNVERHYCQARAIMSDGKKRDLWYVVENPWGYAGLGNGVTYCVSGLDPLRLHGRFCMSLR